MPTLTFMVSTSLSRGGAVVRLAIPAHFIERVSTAVGLTTSLSALVALLLTGAGWVPIDEFVEQWMSLAIFAVPLSLLTDRWMRGLFWLEKKNLKDGATSTT